MSVIQELNQKMPQKLNTRDVIYQALFGKEDFSVSDIIAQSQDFNCGAIANEFEFFRLYTDQLTAVDGVDKVAQAYLDILVETFTTLKRFYAEDDVWLRKRFYSLVRRRGNRRWDTPWAILDVFSYFFDREYLTLVENGPSSNGILNPSFELEDMTMWTLKQSADPSAIAERSLDAPYQGSWGAKLIDTGKVAEEAEFEGGIGPELVVNGDFADGSTNWTLGTGARVRQQGWVMAISGAQTPKSDILPASNGQIWSLTFAARLGAISATSLRAYIELSGGSLAAIGVTDVTAGDGTDWVIKTVYGTISKVDTTGARIVLQANGYTSGTGYFGFAYATIGGVPITANWDFVDGNSTWSFLTNATITYDPANAYMGNAMPGGSGWTLVVQDDGVTGVEANTQTWPAIAGQQFLVNFTAKPLATPTTDGTFRLRWQTDAGSTPAQTVLNVSRDATDWVTTTQTVTCPEDPTITKVWFDYLSQTGDYGLWLIGSVSVKRVARPADDWRVGVSQMVAMAGGIHSLGFMLNGISGLAGMDVVEARLKRGDGKYWDVATRTWVTGITGFRFPFLAGWQYCHEWFKLDTATDVTLYIYSAGNAATVSVDSVEMGPRPDRPTIKLMVQTRGQSGEFMNFFPGNADPVGGADYEDQASFLDDAYIGGSGVGLSINVFTELLKKVKPAGVVSSLVIVT